MPSTAIPAATEYPTPPGCEHWVESHGYDIAQIHYTADPTKGPAWAAAKRKESPSEAIFRQEYEIDYYAQSGALMFPEFNIGLNVCPPFPVPHHWTRYMSIDPHKRRPHAFLWMAVSPDDEDYFFYREYWPSKVYGKRGNVPEDDPLFHIDSYVQTINWLEGPEIDFFGPNGFADNKGQREKIFRRVMDTHGKAIFTTTKDGRDEPETFWDRYRKLGIICKEAVKDVDSGRDLIGKALRPRTVMYSDGPADESRIHVFSTLTELIHELRTNRFPMLTPAQAEVKDPVSQELPKRKHMTDNARYIAMEDPKYIAAHDYASQSVPQLQEGVAY